MNNITFGEKIDLEPSEYNNLFGNPFWGVPGNSKAKSVYFQLSERDKAFMLKANYIKMIANARERNYNKAADNLQWWLDGSGLTKNIDYNWLRKQREVISAENVNIERFEERLELENYSGKLVKEGDSENYTNKLHHAFTGGIFGELYYMCGTSTIISQCNFKITRTKGNIVLSGTINYTWWDTYDWHKGASAYIFGFGNIGDSDALLVEKYCGARPFQMKSQWIQSFNKTFEPKLFGGFSIDLK